MAARMNNEPGVNQELLRSRQTMWRRFTKFTTYAAVAVVIVLVGMAIFLLD